LGRTQIGIEHRLGTRRDRLGDERAEADDVDAQLLELLRERLPGFALDLVCGRHRVPPGHRGDLSHPLSHRFQVGGSAPTCAPRLSPPVHLPATASVTARNVGSVRSVVLKTDKEATFIMSFGMRRTRWALVPALAVGMVLLGAGAATASRPAKLKSATLNGSGSTLQQAFDEEAIAAFTKKNSNVTVNYAGGGSGKGRQ